MNFDPMNFVRNLYYMGVGMLGIFLIIGVIILITVALGRGFRSPSKDESN